MRVPFLLSLSLFCIVLLLNAAYVLDQRQQALIFQFGEVVNVVTAPGLKWKLPFIQRVVLINKRILNASIDDIEVIAKDQKRLIVNAYAKYRVTDPQKFYQTLRDEQGARTRIVSILDSSLRQILGEVTLSSLLTVERANVMRKISDVLTKQSKSFGVEVVDVRILRADLPDENSKATYERMITDRRQQASRFRAEGQEESDKIMADANRQYELILADADKIEQITRGQGEGQASRIYADAFSRDPEFFELYRSLQAYKKALKKDTTTLVLSPESEFLSYFTHKSR